MAAVEMHARGLAVTQLPDVAHRLLHLHAASLSAEMKHAQRKHSITEIADVGEPGLEAVEVCAYVPQPLTHSIGAVIRHSLDLSEAGTYLEIGVRVLDDKAHRGLVVRAYEQTRTFLDQLHVVQRHRPRSIPQAQESA